MERQNCRNKTKIHRGHITILGACAPTEGREEITEELYETLQKILNTVKENIITWCWEEIWSPE